MNTFEFTTQFNKLKMPLYAFALNLTKDKEAANDLVQETAYKAYKYRNNYQPHTNLRAWLMTIMRNAFINDYRKRKRRQMLNDYTPNNYLINSNDAIVTNGGEASLLYRELKKQIEAIDENLQVPFLLHTQGYKYEEIAQELDLPLGTVKSRIFFARKRLQAAIKHIYQAGELADIID